MDVLGIDLTFFILVLDHVKVFVSDSVKNVFPCPISQASLSNVVLSQPLEGCFVDVESSFALACSLDCSDTLRIFISEPYMVIVHSPYLPCLIIYNFFHFFEIYRKFVLFYKELEWVFLKLHKKVVVYNTHHIAVIVELIFQRALILPDLANLFEVVGVLFMEHMVQSHCYIFVAIIKVHL